MKVAVIMPLAELRGGGEMMLWDLMQHGRNQGIEWLTIFLENGPMVQDFQAIGIDARVVQSGRLRELHCFIAAVGKITSMVRQEQVNVIVGWMTKAHLYGGFAAILAGLPSLWYHLAVPSNKFWMDQIATLLPACGIVTLCKVGQEAQKQIWPHRLTQLVYPGVAIDRFNPSNMPTPQQMRHKLGLPLDGPLIGIVGRLQRWKGMHVLINAMPKVLQKYPNAHCVVVGGRHNLEPDYVDYLENQIKVMELGEKVILCGLQHNVAEWIQAIDIFVHASYNEPFGIVIIEAMALGKPVVAGNLGGPTEIITPSLDGILTPYGDENTLADAILHYLNNQEFARSIGAAAQRRALSFTTQHYAENFIRAIHSLVSVTH